MPYSAQISRANPSCFLFIIDQSGSMADPFGGEESPRQKSDGVADAINRLLQNLIIRCAKEEGVRHYFDVGVLGYGARVGSAFAGTLAGHDLVPISEIAESPARIEERQRKMDDGAGGIIEQTVRFPIWFDPVANGGTPMCEALAQAHRILDAWTSQRPASFPPVVIHITDGESTDGDPSEGAARLRSLGTADGNALLFNLHVSSVRATPIVFPGDEAQLPDKFAHLLFGMSSILPDMVRAAAAAEGYTVSEGSRGFAFNADLVSVIKFLEIGTRAELR
jgi:hypothetical protein